MEEQIIRSKKNSFASYSFFRCSYFLQRGAFEEMLFPFQKFNF